MPGVSSRGPVSAADGFGKVYLKFRPVKKRSWLRTLSGVTVYVSFCCLMAFSVGWSRPSIRENILIPIVHCTIYLANLVTFRPGHSLKQPVGEQLITVLTAQGYEHAVNNFVQMEIRRRTAYGKMSELFGEEVADIDMASIAMDFSGIAQRDYESLTEEDKSLLKAYSAGVNEHINEILTASPWTLPLDYAAAFSRDRAAIPIDRWSPVHTLAVMRLVSYQWSTGWEDVVLARLNKYTNVDTDTRAATSPNFVPSIGGSAFVVAGGGTAHGGAVLGSSVESLASPTVGQWVDSCLQSTDLQVCGTSIPGIPLMFSGRNKHISWSLLPSADSFEQLLPVAEGDSSGVIEGTEVLKVRGTGAANNHTLVSLSVQQCVIGGVSFLMISDIASKRLQSSLAAGGVPRMALSSPSLTAPISLQFLLKLSQARNWQDFSAAYALNRAMPLNALYGDEQGNIGSASYRGPDTLPSFILNPQSGYIVAAAPLSPLQQGTGRVEQLVSQFLSAGSKMTADAARLVLSDTFSPSSLRLAHLISALNVETVISNSARQVLVKCQALVAAFDGQYSVDASAPVLLEAFRSALVHNSMDSAAAAASTSNSLSVTALKRSQLADRASQAWVLDMMESPQPGMDRETLIMSSLHHAYTWCEEHFGSTPSAWRWGDAHKAYFAPLFATSKLYLYNAALSRGPASVAGGWDSVHASQYSLADRLSGRDALYSSSSTYLTTHRMVVDMSPSSSKQFCLAASGDSLSSMRSPRLGPLSGQHETYWQNVCLAIDLRSATGAEL